MKLKLNGLEVECVIGELAEERERPQRLEIRVALEIPERAAETDDLADTVDYAALSARIRDALMAAKCRMIERAARVVAEVCLAEPLVAAVEVSVVKRGAVVHLESAEVVYERRR